jgi:hypothetical protein
MAHYSKIQNVRNIIIIIFEWFDLLQFLAAATAAVKKTPNPLKKKLHVQVQGHRHQKRHRAPLYSLNFWPISER